MSANTGRYKKAAGTKPSTLTAHNQQQFLTLHHGGHWRHNRNHSPINLSYRHSQESSAQGLLKKCRQIYNKEDVTKLETIQGKAAERPREQAACHVRKS